MILAVMFDDIISYLFPPLACVAACFDVFINNRAYIRITCVSQDFIGGISSFIG